MLPLALVNCSKHSSFTRSVVSSNLTRGAIKFLILFKSVIFGNYVVVPYTYNNLDDFLGVPHTVI